jgi:hypothetical protein
MTEITISVTVAPILAEPDTLVIYRDSGEEIVVKINKESKTMASSIKITIDEVNFIRENYL